jgi:hypothetical protein
LLVGDAVCSYNPSYGQGMTAATLTARCLDRQLSKHHGPIHARFLRKHYAAQAKFLAEGWEFATILDLRWPVTQGPRPFGLRVRHMLIRLVEQVAFHNPKVLAAVIPFSDFGTSRLSLFNPLFLARLLAGTLHLLLMRPSLPGAAELDPFAQSVAESAEFEERLRGTQTEAG